jgi:hypothetical protein
MKEIGGFFEREKCINGVGEYHKNATNFSYGRVALKALITKLKPNLVYVPFYSCDSLLEPLRQLGIKREFYSLNKKLAPLKKMKCKKGQCIIYINYFGLQQETIKKIIKDNPGRTIIDNTQAFFEKPQTGQYAFNSARKFFGVPDGAYVFGASFKNAKIKRNNKVDISYLYLREQGKTKEAFINFKKQEANIKLSFKKVSKYSENILKKINYKKVARMRKTNFKIYHKYLGKKNKLKISYSSNNVPFCYPLLLSKKIDSRKLYIKKIFFPCLWKEVLTRRKNVGEVEKGFVTRMLPLPVDHRYKKQDIARVCKEIKALI